MQSLIVNGLHLAGAIIGFLVIYRLSSPTEQAWRLWPFTLLSGAAMAIFIFSNSQPALEYLFWDFRYCYWLAGNLIWQGPAALTGAYDGVLFVNIPIVAYLFAPFGLLDPMVASIVFTALGFVAAWYIWKLLVRMFELDRRDSALLCFALCVFGPLIYVLKVGNTSHFMLVLLLVGLLMARSGKDLSAGALFGIATVIKPSLLLIGVLYFLRGRWLVVAGGAAVVTSTVILSLLIFGWDMHVYWYETTIQPFLSDPVLAFSNQALGGMVARFESESLDLVNFAPFDLSPFGKLITQILTLMVVAGMVLAVWSSGRLVRIGNQDLELEVLMLLALSLSISALSWPHYHVWLLPALVLLWVRTRRGELMPQLRWPTAATFALLAGTVFVSHSMTLGRFGPLSNFVVSHWLWGALGTLILLGIVRSQRDSAARIH
jgi:alpha-1,2-mannosyltransferase